MDTYLLTDAELQAAQPSEKRYRLSDGGGLFLVVFPSGSKKWYVIFSMHYLHTRKSIGEYPVITLTEARARLKREKRILDEKVGRLQGIDSRNCMTFSEGAEIWYEDWRRRVRSSTEIDVWHKLKRHALPKLGKKRLIDISDDDMCRLFDDIAKEHLPTAIGIIIYCRKIFAFLSWRRLFRYNPALSVDIDTAIKNHVTKPRPHLELHDLPELLFKIDTFSGLLERYALQLMLIFFTRTQELLGAKWEEFNFDEQLWTIPADRMKNKWVHKVPLPRQSIEILHALKRDTGGGEWLFFDFGDVNPNLILNALYRMGYKGRMCGHGFRHIASEALNDFGNQIEHVERQLSHLVGTTTSRVYNAAQYLPQRRKFMQEWADYLDALRKPRG